MGQRVFLTPPATMGWRDSNPIQKDPRGGCAKECGDPIPKYARESSTLEKVKNVLPLHRVEGFPDVKLEKEGRGFVLMESPSKVPHVREVVMDASRLDEGALSMQDESVHVVAELGGKDLGNHLGHRHDEANRLVV